MHITFAGILWILFFVLFGVALVWITAKREGGGVNIRDIKNINLKDINFKFKKKTIIDDGLIQCINIYEDKIVVENMLKTSVNKDADLWGLGNKKCLLQGIKGKEFIRVELPTEVSYPTERLARLMGCEPLRKLKSLKFGILDKLAPFAPVAALGIGALLFIMVLG